MVEAASERHVAVNLEDLDPVQCLCGESRRAFGDIADSPISVHQVNIARDAKCHYHKRLTEVYYILDCEPGAKLQLDDETVDVKPGTCVLILPGTRHRAIGSMRVLVIVSPKYDTGDEWFD